MLSILWQVSSVLAGTALLMLGTSLLSILLPLSLSRSGFSIEIVGFVMSAYYGGLVLGAIYCMRIIARIGHIRAYACFAAITCAAVLAHPMWVDPFFWIGLRLITGFCLAGLFAVLESWLNHSSGNRTRGRVLSIYLMTTYVSITAGQLLVNLWDAWQYMPYMVGGMVVALSLVPVVMTRVEAPDISQSEHLPARELFRISPLAVVGCVSSGLVLGGFYGMGAIYAKLIQFDQWGVSVFLSAMVVGGFLLQFPIGRLSDKLDRRTVMAVCMLLATGLCAAAIFVPRLSAEIWPIAAIAALCGGPFSVIYPLSTGQAYDYLPKERYVAAAGGLLLAYAVGATAGPIVVSFLMGRLGAEAFFGFFAVVCGLLCLFVVYRMRMRTALPANQQEVYRQVPAYSPVAAELDPRATTKGGAASQAPAGGKPAAVAREP
jgi:MFS family permease